MFKKASAGGFWGTWSQVYYASRYQCGAAGDCDTVNDITRSCSCPEGTSPVFTHQATRTISYTANGLGDGYETRTCSRKTNNYYCLGD